MRVRFVFVGLILCLFAPLTRSQAAESDDLVATMDAAKYSDVLKILGKNGFDAKKLAILKPRLLQSPKRADLKQPFVSAASVGALSSAPREEIRTRIGAATRVGFTNLFWEINDFDPNWTERYDRELTNFPAAPIAVLNVGPNDPNFTRYFQWFDRYAERLHSVVINADNLDNYDFKEAQQQRQANRVMNALYRLIKARQPNAFVWVRVVWADDGSDVNWLKNLSFDPDGLLLWNLPSFRSTYLAALERFRPLSGDQTAFMVGGFYGFWSLLTSRTNFAEIGGAAKAQLPGFTQALQHKGFRGLGADWVLLTAADQGASNYTFALQTDIHTPAQSNRVAWTWEDTGLAYQKVGRTNAAWDKPALEALRVYSWFRSDEAQATDFSLDYLAMLLQSAVGAGCDDPLIYYLCARYASAGTTGSRAYVESSVQATAAMEASRYSDLRKFLACFHGAQAVRSQNPKSTNQPPSFERLKTKATAYLTNIVGTEQIPVDEVRNLCQQWIGPGRLVPTEFGAFQLFENALAEHWSHAAWAWLVRGRAYISYAWEGRGSDWAYKVTEKGWQQFAERLELAEQALANGWRLDPSMKEIAEEMITVELGQGHGRDRMEFWFQKAMQLDPNDYVACHKKMLYLEPKWHGSPAAMIQFGRECVASKEWGGRVPLILLKAYQTLYGYIKSDKAKEFWKAPGVWPDIRSSLEKYFQLNPTDIFERQTYFLYACLAEQWDDANKEMPLLGTIDYNYFGGKAEYDRMIQETKKHAGGGK